MASNQQRTIELRLLKKLYENHNMRPDFVVQAVVTPSRPDDEIRWSGCVREVPRKQGGSAWSYDIPTDIIADTLVIRCEYTSGDARDFTLENLRVTCGNLEVTGADFGVISTGRNFNFYVSSISIHSSIDCIAVSGGGKHLILSNIAAEGLPYAA